MKVRLPPVPDFEDDSEPRLTKKPDEQFPACQPDGCARDCKRFFHSYGKTMSFALYASLAEPNKVCAYARSCGTELLGRKFVVKSNETPKELVTRVIPDLVRLFVEITVQEREEFECPLN